MRFRDSLVKWHPFYLYYEVKEVTTMKIRLISLLFALLLPVMTKVLFADEAQKSKQSPAGVTDTSKVDASSEFLLRWRKLRHLAYETQQTRTASGVRGTESEDFLLAQLFYSPIPRRQTDRIMLERLYYQDQKLGFWSLITSPSVERPRGLFLS